MRTFVPLFALSLLTTLGIGTTPEAQAQNGEGFVRYAKFTIVNPTTHKLSYAVRWGDGKWDETTIKPNESYTHWYPSTTSNWCYIKSARSEPPTKFQSDISPEPRWVAERNGKS